MGLSFRNYHIQRVEGIGRENLLEQLSAGLRKQGYVSCEADDAAFGLHVLIPEHSCWISVVPDQAEDSETEKILLHQMVSLSKALSAYVLIADCIDSDFASLSLVHASKNIMGKLVVGQPYWETESEVVLDAWKELVTDIEHLHSVLEEEYTFAEDGLEHVAGTLGMAEGQIGFMSDTRADENEMLRLYFRQEKKRGKASFKTLFKQVFGEGLQDAGFVCAKGRYPYFMKLIGEEILQVISYEDMWCAEQEYKSFSILGDIYSVYDRDFDFSVKPHDKDMRSLRQIYIASNPAAGNNEYAKELFQFLYRPHDEKDMRKVLAHALKETEKNILSVFEPVQDLRAYFDYLCLFFDYPCPPDYDREKQSFSGGSFLEILLDQHDDLKEYFKKDLDSEMQWARKNPDCIWGSLEEFEKKRYLDGENYRKKILTSRNIIYQNPEIYEKAQEEIKRRRETNLEIISQLCRPVKKSK